MMVPRGEEIMNQSPKSAGLKLALFGVATLVWLAVAIYLGYTARHPDAYCAGTFSCLTASEWGDFLAGVFAPIAFLWLVAAVWIQSDELREQRVELALTREEFKLNRTVMEQQAEEARKQADYISTQTQLLLDEANTRRLNTTESSFLSLLSKYVIYLREHRNEYCRKIDNSSGMPFYLTVEPCSEEQFINKNYSFFNELDGNRGIRFELVDAHVFSSAFVYIYSAEELIDNIPFDSRVFWKRSKLSDLVDQYCQIIISTPQLGELKGHVKARERRLGKRTDDSEVSSLSPDV